MSQVTQISPDPGKTYRNGAGRLAQVGGQDVFYGMEVTVYGLPYWVVDARPSGIGFTLYAVNSEGRTFEFKTREVEVATRPSTAPPAVALEDERSASSAEQDRHRTSIVQNIESIYPNVAVRAAALDDDQLRQLFLALSQLQRSPMPARLPWDTGDTAVLTAACLIAAAHAISWQQAQRIVGDLYRAAPGDAPADGPAGFWAYWSALGRSDPNAPGRHAAEYYELRRAPRWYPQLVAATARPAPERPAPSAPAPAPVAAVEPASAPAPTAPPAPKVRLGGKGDAVSQYLQAAKDPAALRALLARTGYPDPDATVDRYGHLSFGLQKMSVTNLLRKAVRTGTATLDHH